MAEPSGVSLIASLDSLLTRDTFTNGTYYIVIGIRYFAKTFTLERFENGVASFGPLFEAIKSLPNGHLQIAFQIGPHSPRVLRSGLE